MNRGLVLSLCAAVALGAMASVSVADTDLTLNLRYDDPNDPSAGGSWQLATISDEGQGIVGVSAYIENIDDSGVAAGPGVNANVESPPGMIPVKDFGGVVNVVYGQDLSQAVTTGVGQPGGEAIDDPLTSPAWNGQWVLLTGTFGGSRPVFGMSGANETDANYYDGAVGQAVTLGDVKVRGDSVGTDGLPIGDANRDWTTNSDDFDLLAVNFLTSAGWDLGDFNSSGFVDSDDFDLLAVNFLASSTPPAVGGVPEPASAALLVLAAAGALVARKRIAR